MITDIEKAIKDVKELQRRHTNTELQLAIQLLQLQRNKILKEELSAIYSVLDDIRYNRCH